LALSNAKCHRVKLRSFTCRAQRTSIFLEISDTHRWELFYFHKKANNAENIFFFCSHKLPM
jgi:hypothetical protein